MTKSIQDNANCLKIFEENLDIDAKFIKEHDYFDDFLTKIINENKNSLFERFLYLKLIRRGEVISATNFSIGIMSNGKGVITKYISENGKPKRIKKVINDFNVDTFYSKINKKSSVSDRIANDLLIIDFESSNNNKCSFYRFSEGEKLYDLTFFGNSSD